MTKSLFQQFLSQHSIKKNSELKSTHTRIGDVNNNVYPGSFHISDTDLDVFHHFYHKEIIKENGTEYLTEKQATNNDGSVVYVDLDFRYNIETGRRAHNSEWIKTLIGIYGENIKKIYKLDGETIKAYVMERQTGYAEESKQIYKDGIHILFDIPMNHKYQEYLRKSVMKSEDTVELLSELPLENSINDVFDEGLSKGSTNVQLFGSNKPNRKKYELTQIVTLKHDPTDNEIGITSENHTGDIDFETFKQLSVHSPRANPYTVHSDVKKELQTENDKNTATLNNVKSYHTANSATDDIISEYTEYCSILKLEEIDDYHSWKKLVWALASMGEEFKSVAITMSQKSNKFDIEGFEAIWEAFNPETNVLSKEYILKYAKEGNPTEYSKIRMKYHQNIFLKACIEGNERQIAELFREMYADEYVFTDKIKQVFYYFDTKKLLWVQSIGGDIIRNRISHLTTLFDKKLSEYIEALQYIDDDNEENSTKLKSDIKKMTANIKQLSNNTKKRNVYNEIKDLLICDDNFERKLNHINGFIPIQDGKIIDTKDNSVRMRKSKDLFNYESAVEFKENMTEEEYLKAHLYWLSLFNGCKETMELVISIFKSVFSGVKLRYIFFFVGSGRNGKSLMFNLLKLMFSKSMGVISTDVILEKKQKNQINTEIEKLEVLNFAYVTELCEDDVLNTVTVKKISGGDDIDCRALFKTNRTITPKSTLFIPTNEMPNIKWGQAIKDRVVVIPMNNRFEVDADFESNMIKQLSNLFTYIMKQGVISDKVVKTDEMILATEDVASENDVLPTFIDEFYTKCDVINKYENRCEYKEFRCLYSDYLRGRSRKPDTSSDNKFSRKLNNLNLEIKKSNNVKYILGLRFPNGDEDTENRVYGEGVAESK